MRAPTIAVLLLLSSWGTAGAGEPRSTPEAVSAVLEPPREVPAPPFAALERSIAGGEFGAIVSLVVEQHGVVLHEHAFRPGTTRHRRRGAEPALHDVRSASKSITALAVGAAIADGTLASVDALVWPLLGEPEDGPHAGIRVRDLLTMSSALDCDDGRPRSPGNEERMYRRRSWRAFALTIPVDPQIKRDAEGLGRFSYCTAGVFLLSQVVEAATGEAFDAYVQRRLFDPLGIERAVWNRSRTGEVQAGGQLEIAAADLGKIGRLVLDGGTWQGQRLLPAAWIQQVLTPWRRLNPMTAYGYLWWYRPVRSPRGWEASWSMMGKGGNLVAILRDQDAVITVQSANYQRKDAHDRSFAIVEGALAELPLP